MVMSIFNTGFEEWLAVNVKAEVHNELVGGSRNSNRIDIGVSGVLTRVYM